MRALVGLLRTIVSLVAIVGILAVLAIAALGPVIFVFVLVLEAVS